MCYWSRERLELDEEGKGRIERLRTGIEVIAGLILRVDVMF